jgi:hypothetical protein
MTAWLHWQAGGAPAFLLRPIVGHGKNCAVLRNIRGARLPTGALTDIGKGKGE